MQEIGERKTLWSQHTLACLFSNSLLPKRSGRTNHYHLHFNAPRPLQKQGINLP